MVALHLLFMKFEKAGDGLADIIVNRGHRTTGLLNIIRWSSWELSAEVAEIGQNVLDSFRTFQNVQTVRSCYVTLREEKGRVKFLNFHMVDGEIQVVEIV